MSGTEGILAVITARGGSKGVPGKNVRPLRGRPLIAHTVEAALNARRIGRVVVTTDAPEIADAAVAAGAERLFLRPAEFALDSSPSWQAVVHLFGWLREHEGTVPADFCLLQPTSPFRTARHIDEAAERFIASKADSLVSVCRSKKSPYWSQVVGADGFLRPAVPSERAYERRQDAPQTYDLNGAVYFARTAAYEEQRTFLTARTAYYEMDDLASLDIDTELDFRFAEMLAAGQ